MEEGRKRGERKKGRQGRKLEIKWSRDNEEWQKSGHGKGLGNT